MKYLVIALLLLNGCGNSSYEYAEEFVEDSKEPLPFNSEFTGRIVHEDRTPYTNGSVRAVSENWSSYVMTNDNGEFVIPVYGDERFILSAWSPYGDNKYYPYVIPLIVPEYESGHSYECEYKIEIITCYDNNIVR